MTKMYYANNIMNVKSFHINILEISFYLAKNSMKIIFKLGIKTHYYYKEKVLAKILGPIFFVSPIINNTHFKRWISSILR